MSSINYINWYEKADTFYGLPWLPPKVHPDNHLNANHNKLKVEKTGNSIALAQCLKGL